MIPREATLQDASKLIASSDCQHRLHKFGEELVRLCNKYYIRIMADQSFGGDILVEDKRRAPDPDWPSVAFFSGVDEQGVYNQLNPKHAKCLGMRLAEKEED